MITAEERSKLKNVYIVVLIFTTFKGYGVLVPNANVLLSSTYLTWTDGYNFNSSTEAVPTVHDLALQWIDSLLLLEVLCWEMFPLELYVFRKWPLGLYHIFVWTLVHFLLSLLYISNRILQMDGEDSLICVGCSIPIFLQSVSACLAYTILRLSRKMVRVRLGLA